MNMKIKHRIFVWMLMASLFLTSTVVCAEESSPLPPEDIAVEELETEETDAVNTVDETDAGTVINKANVGLTVENEKKSSETLSLLLALGIISESEANEEQVSRGLFAKVYAIITGLNNEAIKPSGVYNDVPETHKYAQYIEVLSRYKVMTGTADNKFLPDTPIQYDTAVNYLAIALGVNNIQNDNGVTFYSFYNQITKGVSKSTSLSGKALTVMIYNTLFADVVRVESYSSDGIKYAITDTNNLLYKTFGVYSVTGDVIENDITGLWALSELSVGHVKIKSTNETLVFSTGNTDIGTKLGYNVKVYLKETNDLDIEEEVLFYHLTKKNEIEVISLEDFDPSHSNISILNYTKNERQTSIKLSDLPAVIYNGKSYDDGTFDFTQLAGCYGTITAIIMGDSNRYNVVNIEAYKDLVVESVYFKDDTISIYDKNESNVLVVNENIFYDTIIRYQSGARASVYEITYGMVLSVGISGGSDGNKILTVIISDFPNLSVDITEIHSDGGEVLAGGDVYTLSPSMSSTDGIILGFAAIKLNAYGYIASIKSFSDFQFGLVTNFGLEEGVSGIVKVRLFFGLNQIQELTVANNVVVDGTRYKNKGQSVWSLLGSQEVVKISSGTLPSGVFPIRFKLNSKGEINEIDTLILGGSEDKDSLTIVNTASHVLTNDGIFGRVTPTRSDTVLLRLWNNNISNISFLEDETYMKMTTMKDLTKNAAYSYVAYKVDSTSEYAEFVITTHGYGNSADDYFLIVDQITEGYDTELGMDSIYMSGMQNGVKKKVLVSEKFLDDFRALNISQGDVLRYKTDSYGKLIRIDQKTPQSKYNLNDKTVKLVNIAKGQTNLSNIYQYTYTTYIFNGFVYDRKDDLITIAFKDLGTINARPVDADFDNATMLKFIVTRDTIVTVFDPSLTRNKVFMGQYNEILDYKHHGLECSRVLLRFRSGALKEIVVFNDASLFD